MKGNGDEVGCHGIVMVLNNNFVFLQLGDRLLFCGRCT